MSYTPTKQNKLKITGLPNLWLTWRGVKVEDMCGFKMKKLQLGFSTPAPTPKGACEIIDHTG